MKAMKKLIQRALGDTKEHTSIVSMVHLFVVNRLRQRNIYSHHA
ncbi:hypothetical protein HanHA300_Chr06g0206281 [Helianthus annuus]|nr:hypothetical protein HanHA300_Chr06g0206281 [Helianthus annuus]KAJ0572952.1 hypothetical protein HanHA89_Chr06g0221421 [Helianthus annuus]KAJ0737395.1 hypothetical protein HanLR1_Chr06g0206531 [Helianthus annuus]